MPRLERQLADQAATERLGAQLAACCRDGLLVYLQGQLGAGKTTLVRGLLRGLGHNGPVKSPTYALLEPYTLTRGTVYHLDLYRLAEAEELEWIGIRDLLDGVAICLIEWPEKGAGYLPAADLLIEITLEGDARRVRLCSASPLGAEVLACLAES